MEKVGRRRLERKLECKVKYKEKWTLGTVLQRVFQAPYRGLRDLLACTFPPPLLPYSSVR